MQDHVNCNMLNVQLCQKVNSRVKRQNKAARGARNDSSANCLASAAYPKSRTTVMIPSGDAGGDDSTGLEARHAQEDIHLCKWPLTVSPLNFG